MTMRLSLRPDLDQNVDGLPIYLSGAFANAQTLTAYEGRIQIHNSIGRCSAELLQGSDALPPGGSVYIDHATQEVVIAWPAYSQYVTPLENPGFETGNIGGWSFVPRGGSAVPTVDTTYRYEGARSLRWPGGRGMGSEGGIEVEAWNNTIGPCLPGQRITIRFRGMYNPAGHHFGSQYRALVRFLDGDGDQIGSPQRGALVKGRGQNGRWNDASVSATAPAATAGVQLGAWLTGSEAPTWMDAASWDVPSSLGIDVEAVINVSLRVRDSAGRTAIWTGAITVADIDPIAVGIMAKLTSWWALDETEVVSGVTRPASLQHDSVNDNHVTRNGASMLTAPGRSAGRLSPKFGNGLYGRAITPSLQVAGLQWCHFGWFNVYSLPGMVKQFYLVSQWNGAGAYWLGPTIEFFQARFGAVIGNVGTYVRTNIPESAVSAGAWQFVVAWREGNFIHIELNNSVLSVPTAYSGATGDQTHPFAFGGYDNTGMYDGSIQDWGWIKGGHLTAEERAWMFNGGAGRTIDEIKRLAGI